MHPRVILLFVFVFITLISSAQDKIYTRKKGMIEAVIMEVTKGRIYYRKAEEPAGTNLAIDWDDVHKVEYANGKVDYRRPIPELHNIPMVYDGKYIASIAVMSIGDEGVGMGLAYERALDEAAFFSLFLPVSIVFASAENSRAFTEDPLARNRTIFQFSPGVKLYPTRNNGKIRYAVGPQLAFEAGDKHIATRKTTAQRTDYFVFSHHQVQKIGVMVNNSLNLFPSPRIYMGIDLGMGVTFSHKLSGKESGAAHLIQGNFRMGYRF